MEKRLREIMARKEEIRSALALATAEEVTAFEAELKALDVEVKELEHKQEIAEKLNRGALKGNPIAAPAPVAIEEKHGSDSMEYRKAFMNYVLRGTAIPVELRVDAITATSDIGAVIPDTVLNKIVEKIEAVGMILNRVTRTSIKGGVTVPTSSVKPVATWVAEGSGSDKQKKGTGSITFAYNKLRCAVAVTLEVDNVALPVFEAALISNITTAMVKAIEQSIISGDGTGECKGILAETPVTGQAIDATPVYAKFVEAEGLLPLEYEANAVWVMTKKTFGQLLAQTGSDGHPIARVNMGIDGKPARMLLGREVVLCNYIDTYASGLTDETPWAFLFDFADYALNTNYAMAIKKYEDNDTDDQVTKAIMLVDGKCLDINSLVVLKK